MNLASLPLFDELKDSKNILIAGAGGGFDVFSGLPIYFALRKHGKKVFLANLSFSNLFEATGVQLTPSAFLVNADSRMSGYEIYFPEKHLCEWFRAQGEEIEICCFESTGVLPLLEAYKLLCQRWQIDAIILADGGIDSLMRGDEADLGTPQEDMASIAAVNGLAIEKSFLLCTAFGIEQHICHAQFLEAVAALSKTGDFLGAFSLLKDMEEARLYQEAYKYVAEQMSYSSIISSSIISAVQGEYGDFHATSRTHGSRLWINPLTNMYWSFRLAGVAARSLYLEQIKETVADYEIGEIIWKFRAVHPGIKAWEKIPL